MTTKEEEFLVRLLETFQVEADEHLKVLSDGLIALEKKPSKAEHDQIVESIYREAHSLKGAARSVNQRTIQEICQELENILSAMKNGIIEPSRKMFDALHRTVDALEKGLKEPPDQIIVDSIVDELKSLMAAPTNETAPSVSLPEVLPKIEKLMGEEVADKPAANVAHEGSRDKTIRISLAKLDRLFQETEEMLMVKLVAQQDSTDLRKLLIEFNTREKELAKLLSETLILRHATSQEGIPFAERKAFNKILGFLDQQQKASKRLKEEIRRLAKTSEQNSHFVGALVDTLLEDIKKVLMQPISTLLDGMPRMVRDISRDLGKDVVFETQGGDIEVDRRILEEIKDPLIHLIRNAIDHGIESPEERINLNKSPTGTIRINATESSGGNVELSVSDDGRGFDIDGLKAAAMKQGITSSQDLNHLSDTDAMKLAFSSGVSTSPTITDLSGRGLGLGIVSEKTDKLGGNVLIESHVNQGTTFRLILPLTLATFRGIHITVAGQEFVMPTHNVNRVLRIQPSDIKTLENSEAISVDGQQISFVHLANLLTIARDNDDPAESLYALLIKSEEKMVAFGANAIHREHEVLVKGLGKQCVRVKNIMAATILESGKVVPILNPSDLVRNAIRGEVHQLRSLKISKGEEKQKKVLVAEDSITTRLLLKNILESAGYDVSTASDGAEAFDFLSKNSVDLLVSDVEMPRMDGFKLTQKVRETKNLSDLPIIICTGKASKEDRERGIELGANAYLDKSTFNQTALLSAAQKLL